MTTLTEKDPAEIVPVSFDFAGLTAAPLTPVITVEHYSGTVDEGTLSDMLESAAAITGTKVVQRIGGGVNGATYLLRCDVTTADNLAFTLTAKLPVRTAGKP